MTITEEQFESLPKDLRRWFNGRAVIENDHPT
jgi:hypothetical protein